MSTLNTADLIPVGLGISAVIRQEAKRDGSPVMVQYVRAELADPASVSKISDKGNVTVATVGQRAPMPAVQFPSGAQYFPNLSFSVWGKVQA